VFATTADAEAACEIAPQGLSIVAIMLDDGDRERWSGLPVRLSAAGPHAHGRQAKLGVLVPV
jgi:hypothetical protein